jgi:hypothetical protein
MTQFLMMMPCVNEMLQLVINLMTHDINFNNYIYQLIKNVHIVETCLL